MKELRNLQQLHSFLDKSLGCAYVYGGTGKPCSPAYREARMKQYPAQAAAIRKHCPVLSGKAAGCGRCRYRGRPCYDCAQLVRLALREAGILLPSGASSQWRAKGLWAWQGPIGPQAAHAVCLLFRRDDQGSASRPMAHVGISTGDGYAVDARGHAAGVIRSRITAYPWTHMAFPLGFPLPLGLGLKEAQAQPPAQEQDRPAPVDLHGLHLQPGDRGPMVRLLQTQLLRLGYPLPRFGADGIYGRETAAALRAFQHVAGLPPSGIADPAAMALLFPRPAPREEDPFWEEDPFQEEDVFGF